MPLHEATIVCLVLRRLFGSEQPLLSTVAYVVAEQTYIQIQSIVHHIVVEHVFCYTRFYE